MITTKFIMDNTETNSNSKKKCATWKKRTIMEKYLILICLTMFVTTISFIAILAFYEHIYRHPLRNICISSECKREVGIILKNIDSSINPCDDFYDFACGSFMKYKRSFDETFVTFTDGLEYMLRYYKEVLETADENVEPDFIRKVKKFYQSCMNTPSDTTKTINVLLSESKIRVWPFPVYGESLDGLPTLEEALSLVATSTEIGEKMALFHLSSLGRNLTLDKGKMFVSEAIFLNTTDGELLKKKQKYRRLLALTLFQVQKPSYNMEDEINNIIDFQTSVAKLSNYSRKENNTITTFSELESICPMIKWTLVLKYIYEKFGQSDMVKNINETVITVRNIEYLKDLCELIHNVGHAVVHNFLVWNFLGEALFWLDASFHQSFNEIDPSSDQLHGRYNKFYSVKWKYCINAVRKSKTIHPGLNYLIINNLKPERAINEIISYIKSVKAVMDHTLSKASWLDNHTRKLFQEKLRKLKVVVGFSKESRNIKLLMKHFDKVIVTKNYVENWIRNRNHLFSAYFFKDTFILQSVTRIEDRIYYGSKKSGYKLVIPLEMLIPPVFTSEIPKYLNYGKIGVIIAQKLSYIIDTGNEFPVIANGVNDTLQKLQMKSECYVSQYSKFSRNTRGIKIKDREITRNLIADNNGIVHAFSVYSDYILKNAVDKGLPDLSYTNRQMFFIRYAQMENDLKFVLNPFLLATTENLGKI